MPFCTGSQVRPELIGRVPRPRRPHYLGIENRRVSTRRLATAERLAGNCGVPTGAASRSGLLARKRAICLTVSKPGDKVIVARTIHKSLFFGTGARRTGAGVVRPDIDAQTGLTAGMPVKRVTAEALKEHPDAKAVMLVEPSYVGGVSDVAAHAELAHAHSIPGRRRRWGAHLGFHPDLPPHHFRPARTSW